MTLPANLTLTTMIKSKAEVHEEFGKVFGEDGPECNSDSIGRQAGCDDCAGSIAVQREHRDFLDAQRTADLEAVVEMV